MSEFTARVTRNGQVTIPIEIRQPQKIKKGDLVKLTFVEVVQAVRFVSPQEKEVAAKA